MATVFRLPKAFVAMTVLASTFRRLFAGLGLGLMAAGLMTAPVSAQEQFKFIDEVRFGAFAHDPFNKEDDGKVDAAFELLTSRLPIDTGNSFTDLLIPKLHAGAMINFAGKTSYGYTGFTWQFPVFGPVFLEGALSFALHNGKEREIPGRAGMGCAVNFREFGGIGVDIGPNWRVIAGVEHVSHAGVLCKGENDGLTNIGARVGYRF